MVMSSSEHSKSGTSAAAHAVASRSVCRCASALSGSGGGRRSAGRVGAEASPRAVGTTGTAPARAVMQVRSVEHAGIMDPSRGERRLKSSAIPQSKPTLTLAHEQRHHKELAGRGRWRSRGWSAACMGGGAAALASRPDTSENIVAFRAGDVSRGRGGADAPRRDGRLGSARDAAHACGVMRATGLGGLCVCVCALYIYTRLTFFH